MQIAHSVRDATSAQAVLFHRDALGPECTWIEAVRKLKLTLPEARLIACHEFSEEINWPELSEAGAFHALGVPLRTNEVRQSLGFLSAAENRLSAGL